MNFSPITSMRRWRTNAAGADGIKSGGGLTLGHDHHETRNRYADQGHNIMPMHVRETKTWQSSGHRTDYVDSPVREMPDFARSVITVDYGNQWGGDLRNKPVTGKNYLQQQSPRSGPSTRVREKGC